MMLRTAPIALLNCLFLCLGVVSVNAQTDEWQRMEGPYGPVTCSAIGTAPDGKLFAGVNGAGIYTSTNSGEHWTLTGTQPSLRYSQSILIARNGNVFVCSYRDFNNYGSSPGVTRSTDGGITWTSILPLAQTEVVGLAETSSGLLFLGGPNHLTVDRSTDNGDTWETVLNRKALSIAADSRDRVYAVADSTILYSADSGKSWTAPSTNLRNKVVRDLRTSGRGIIFALAYDRSNSLRDSLMRSTDGGATWTSIGPALVPSYSPVGDFTSDPKGESVFAPFAGIVYRTTDDGMSWSKVYGEGGSAVSDCAFDSSGNLLAGTNFGVIRSSDLGATWDTISRGFIAPRITSLLCTPAGTTLAGTTGAGPFRSSDDGNSWSSMPVPVRGDLNRFLLHPSGFLLASSSYGPLARSTDEGLSWTNVWCSSYDNYVGVSTNGTIYAAGTISMFPQVPRSTDEGQTWTDKWKGGQTSADEGGPNGFLVSPSGAALVSIYWKNGTTTLHRSIDSGATWVRVGIGYPSDRFSAEMLSTPSNRFYAATSTHGLFVSTDNGTIWEPSNSGLSDTHINAIAVNSRGHVFVGTEYAGVFRSIDEGQSWSPFSEGLMDLSVLSLAVDRDGYLFAGARSSGVWRSASPTTEVASDHGALPLAFTLEQNYPNPFNPTTGIKYQLAGVSHVKIAVYDLIGREVAVLVNEEKGPGSYQVTFNGTGMSSGVYVCRLIAGAEVMVRKMLLLR